MQDYNGFNMVVGDISSTKAAYMTNRGQNRAPLVLQAGLHGFSNGSSLQQEWHKVQYGKARMHNILRLESADNCIPASGSKVPTDNRQSFDARERNWPETTNTGPDSLRDPQLGAAFLEAASVEATQRQQIPGECCRAQTGQQVSREQQIGNIAISTPLQPATAKSARVDQATESSVHGLVDTGANSHLVLPTGQQPEQQSNHRGMDRAASNSMHDLPWDELFGVMQDGSAIADDAQLPVTGMPEQVERMLSPIFIDQHHMKGESYGTRTQTILAVWHDGHTMMQERNLQQDGSWKEEKHCFKMPL